MTLINPKTAIKSLMALVPLIQINAIIFNPLQLHSPSAEHPRGREVLLNKAFSIALSVSCPGYAWLRSPASSFGHVPLLPEYLRLVLLASCFHQSSPPFRELFDCLSPTFTLPSRSSLSTSFILSVGSALLKRRFSSELRLRTRRLSSTLARFSFGLLGYYWLLYFTVPPLLLALQYSRTRFRART
ncbi:hypothetical protein EI94DRAFT_1804787 [Lactarius quietus]|nr:hypothetical protein EI94DRAFT_1804787 [Lactarius quietus]